jgi:hypothetical protein
VEERIPVKRSTPLDEGELSTEDVLVGRAFSNADSAAALGGEFGRREFVPVARGEIVAVLLRGLSEV